MYPVPPRPETQGRTEIALGKWLKTRTRHNVVVATKVSPPSPLRARPKRLVVESQGPMGALVAAAAAAGASPIAAAAATTAGGVHDWPCVLSLMRSAHTQLETHQRIENRWYERPTQNKRHAGDQQADAVHRFCTTYVHQYVRCLAFVALGWVVTVFVSLVPPIRLRRPVSPLPGTI